MVRDRRVVCRQAGRGPVGGRCDGRVLWLAARGQAALPRRRSALRAHPGPGCRGSAHRERTAVHGVPAAGGGTRDHSQPDCERHARAAARHRLARAAAGRPGPAAGRGRGTASLRQPGQQRHREVHDRADRDRRHHDPRRPGGSGGAELSEPGSGAVRVARSTGTPARHRRAHGVWPRDPLLPGRAASPAGGRGRIQRPAGPVPGHDAGGRAGIVALAAEHAHPWS